MSGIFGFNIIQQSNGQVSFATPGIEPGKVGARQVKEIIHDGKVLRVSRDIFDKSIGDYIGIDGPLEVDEAIRLETADPAHRVTLLVKRVINRTGDTADLGKLLPVAKRMIALQKEIASLERLPTQQHEKILEGILKELNSLEQELNAKLPKDFRERPAEDFRKGYLFELLQLKRQLEDLKGLTLPYLGILGSETFNKAIFELRSKIQSLLSLTAGKQLSPAKLAEAQKQLDHVLEELAKVKDNIEWLHNKEYFKKINKDPSRQYKLKYFEKHMIFLHMLKEIHSLESSCRPIYRHLRQRVIDSAGEQGESSALSMETVDAMHDLGTIAFSHQANLQRVHLPAHRSAMFKGGYARAVEDMRDGPKVMQCFLPSAVVAQTPMGVLSHERLRLESTKSNAALRRGFTSDDPSFQEKRFRNQLLEKIAGPPLELAKQLLGDQDQFAKLKDREFEYEDSTGEWITVKFINIQSLILQGVITDATPVKLKAEDSDASLPFKNYLEANAEFAQAYHHLETQYAREVLSDQLRAERDNFYAFSRDYNFSNSKEGSFKNFSFKELNSMYRRGKIDPDARIVVQGVERRFDEVCAHNPEFFAALAYIPRPAPSHFAFVPDLDLGAQREHCLDLTWFYYDGDKAIGVTFEQLTELWKAGVIAAHTEVETHTKPKLAINVSEEERTEPGWQYRDEKDKTWKPITGVDHWEKLMIQGEGPTMLVKHVTKEKVEETPLRDIWQADAIKKNYEACESFHWVVDVGEPGKPKLRAHSLKELQRLWLLGKVNPNTPVKKEKLTLLKNIDVQKMYKEGYRVYYSTDHGKEIIDPSNFETLRASGKINDNTQVLLVSEFVAIRDCKSPNSFPDLVRALNVRWKFQTSEIYEATGEVLTFTPVRGVAGKPFIEMHSLAGRSANYVNFNLNRLSPQSEANLIIFSAMRPQDLHMNNIGMQSDISEEEFARLGEYQLHDRARFQSLASEKEHLARSQFSYGSKTNVSLQELQEDYSKRRLKDSDPVSITPAIITSQLKEASELFEALQRDAKDGASGEESSKMFAHLSFSYCGKDKVSYAQVLNDFKAGILTEFTRIERRPLGSEQVTIARSGMLQRAVDPLLQRALAPTAEVVLYDYDQILYEGRGWQEIRYRYKPERSESDIKFKSSEAETKQRAEEVETQLRVDDSTPKKKPGEVTEHYFPFVNHIICFGASSNPSRAETIDIVSQATSGVHLQDLSHWVHCHDAVVRMHIGEEQAKAIIDPFLERILSRPKYTLRHLQNTRRYRDSTKQALRLEFVREVSNLSEHRAFWQSLQDALNVKAKGHLKNVENAYPYKTDKGHDIPLVGESEESQKLREHIANEVFPRLTFPQEKGVRDDISALNAYMEHYRKFIDFRIEFMPALPLEECQSLLQSQLAILKEAIADPAFPLLDVGETGRQQLLEKLSGLEKQLQGALGQKELIAAYREAQILLDSFQQACSPSQLNAYKVMNPGLGECVALAESLAIPEKRHVALSYIGNRPVEWMIEAGLERDPSSSAYKFATIVNDRKKREIEGGADGAGKLPPSRIMRVTEPMTRSQRIAKFRKDLGIG